MKKELIGFIASERVSYLYVVALIVFGIMAYLDFQHQKNDMQTLPVIKEEKKINFEPAIEAPKIAKLNDSEEEIMKLKHRIAVLQKQIKQPAVEIHATGGSVEKQNKENKQIIESDVKPLKQN